MIEGFELENDEDVTNGERDEKSIVVARESGCCVKAERTDGGRAGDAVVVDPAASDVCVWVNVCGPLGVGVLLSVYVVELFAGLDV